MTDIIQLIKSIPKAELHLHIEGSLEPELMFDLAKRNSVELPYKDVDSIRAAYQFTNLQDFLDIYYAGMSVLQTRDDFYELTMAYLKRCVQDNVTHVEIFFDPQGHTERGIAFETVILGIQSALQEGQKRFGISYKIIMCFLRHLSEEEAFETLEEATQYLKYIDGVGLDSSELGHPPEKFERVFAKAKDLGLKLVAHAGEEGPPEYVEQALDLLKVDRIDHGNRAMESDSLIKRLSDSQIALTVCPLSNLKLCVVNDLKEHPIVNMLNQGLLATINSDDPSYFGGYMNDNFLAIHDCIGLTPNQVIKLAKNSFLGSFLSEDEKSARLALIDKRLSELAAE